MLKKILLSLLLIISFIAGAGLFAWKPLLINTVNNALALQNASLKLTLIDIEGINLHANKLQVDSLRFTINGRMQSLYGIEILGELSQGRFSQVKISQLNLDLPEPPTTATADAPLSDQAAISAASLSQELQLTLSQLEPNFKLDIEDIKIRQFNLPLTRFQLHSPNKQTINGEWQLGHLSLTSSINLNAKGLAQHNLLQDLSNDKTATILWQQDSQCRDSNTALLCKITAEVDIQQLALLSQQADIAALATQVFSNEDWQNLQQSLNNSQGHWSINADISQPLKKTDQQSLEASLSISTTETIKLALAPLLKEIPLHSLEIEQSKPFIFHWQEGQLKQQQASQFNLRIIDENQQALPVSLIPQQGHCNSSLECSGSIKISTSLHPQHSKKHALLKASLQGMNWQQWQINPILQWQLNAHTIQIQAEEKNSFQIKKWHNADNQAQSISLTPKALDLKYQRANGDISFTATALHLYIKEFNNAQISTAKIHVQLNNMNFQYQDHKLSAQTHLQGKLNSPLISSNNTQLADLNISGPLTLNKNLLDIGLKLNHSDTVLLQLQGRHYLADQSGHAQWSIPALEMNQAQPLHQLVGLKTLPVWINQGQFKAHGQADWGDQIQVAGTLNFSDIGGSFEDYRFQGFSGALMLQADDNNLSYASFGKLHIQEVNVGVEIKDVAVSINGRSDDEIIHISDFRANFLDGELLLNAYQFDLKNDQHKGLLQLENLSLNEVIQVVDTPGLSGSGLLNGRLPFAINGSDFTISNGLIYSTPPGGLINYRDENMANANIAMAYVYDALSNYHYQQMVSSVDLTDQGKLILGVSMRGKNPDFENGRSINLNLNLDDDIMQQMRSFNAINDVTEKVEKHYQ